MARNRDIRVDLKADGQEGIDRTLAMGQALKRAAEQMRRFTQAMREAADQATLMDVGPALRDLQACLTGTVTAGEAVRAAIAGLRGALCALAEPLAQTVIPLFVRLVELAGRAAAVIAQVMALLFGTGTKSAGAAKGWKEEEKAISGVGRAAREAEGSLAAFDEINQIETEDRGGGGGGSTGGLTAGDPPDLKGLVGSALNAVAELFTGLALLALGAVLTFSGANVPLGLGLMALGAVFLTDAVTANWEAVSQALQGSLGAVLALVSGAVLALGAVLAFSGANLPLGIALMAVGVAGLAAAAAANWDALAKKLQGPVGAVTALAGGALLALGTVLAFSGANLPLGIALMAAGAAGLTAAAAANWDALAEKLRGPVGAVTALASGALLALGVILLFTGAGIPLGLGLLLAGAAGLAAAVAPNWGWLREKLAEVWDGVREVLGKIRDGVETVFSGLWDFVRGVINKILGGVESFVNGFIDAVNFLLSGLNALGSVFGFELNWAVNPVSIPRLARGAVVPPNREFMAVLGDNKQETEVVSPLSTIRQAVREALQESGSLGGDIHITVELDGKVVARNTVRHINQMTRTAGRPVLLS